MLQCVVVCCTLNPKQVPEVAPSQVSRQQLDSLMNAATCGPCFLEKRILHLYQSGEFGMFVCVAVCEA